ncbi:MAG: beta-ketoacyl-ACP synthase II [bacterium]
MPTQNKRLSENRVVITGIGMINPVGNNVSDSWQSLINGRSGLSVFEHELLKNTPWKSFGLVKNEQEILDKVLTKNEQRKTDRFIHLAMIAANEALNDAGITNSFPESRDRFSIFLGIGVGGIDSIYESLNDLNQGGTKKVSPFLIPKSISNEASSWISIKHNLQGQLTTIVNACSSSSDAIGFAFRNIRDGYSDYALAGGTESAINPLSISAFGNMRALSTWNDDPKKASRPFDKNRTGFVLSEGSAVLILQNYETAKKSGAKIYAEIIGYGATSDAYHITAMHPEGFGAKRAINLALRDAQISPEQINYINAHGTGTPMNDPVETKILKDVFGEYINQKNENHILVSSTKSMTGHLLGAAGALEIAITALTLQNQIVPPTINLDEPDQHCDLDYVSKKAKSAKINFALSNSFGFGGANSVVGLKKI